MIHPDTISDEEIAAAIEQAKREIVEDMCTAVSSRKTVMPLDVSSFSELHDYVDANEYGGLCAERAWWLEVESDNMVASNKVQDTLNEWIEDGHARVEKVATVLFTQFGLFGDAPTVSWWEQSSVTQQWWRTKAREHMTALDLPL